MFSVSLPLLSSLLEEMIDTPRLNQILRHEQTTTGQKTQNIADHVIRQTLECLSIGNSDAAMMQRQFPLLKRPAQHGHQIGPRPCAIAMTDHSALNIIQPHCFMQPIGDIGSQGCLNSRQRTDPRKFQFTSNGYKLRSCTVQINRACGKTS